VAPVRGSVIGLDGAPAAYTRVVAASVEPTGNPCGHVLAETRTDVKGRFEIPAIRKTYRVTWIVPALDIVEPRYLVCVLVADTLRPAFLGAGSIGDGFDTVDSLGCIEWMWRDFTRVSCDSRRQNAVVSGGRWADGHSSGYFRLIIAGETGPLNYTGLVMRAGVYVQWVEGSPGIGQQPVRSSATMPGIMGALEIDEPRIEERPDSAACASVRVKTKRPVFGFRHERVAVRLGRPGDLRPDASCNPG